MDARVEPAHDDVGERMILSNLASPAEASFAKAGNRFPLFGIML
jgi:hypothetical protein